MPHTSRTAFENEARFKTAKGFPGVSEYHTRVSTPPSALPCAGYATIHAGYATIRWLCECLLNEQDFIPRRGSKGPAVTGSRAPPTLCEKLIRAVLHRNTPSQP